MLVYVFQPLNRRRALPSDVIDQSVQSCWGVPLISCLWQSTGCVRNRKTWCVTDASAFIIVAYLMHFDIFSVVSVVIYLFVIPDPCWIFFLVHIPLFSSSCASIKAGSILYNDGISLFCSAFGTKDVLLLFQLAL